MNEATTWRKMIQDCMDEDDLGDSMEDICSIAGDIDVHLDAGFGIENGPPFTVWTFERVYFPVVYDGAESVRSVSRDPNRVATKHVGH